MNVCKFCLVTMETMNIMILLNKKNVNVPASPNTHTRYLKFDLNLFHHLYVILEFVINIFLLPWKRQIV